MPVNPKLLFINNIVSVMKFLLPLPLRNVSE